jgi:hypothetical protein
MRCVATVASRRWQIWPKLELENVKGKNNLGDLNEDVKTIPIWILETENV